MDEFVSQPGAGVEQQVIDPAVPAKRRRRFPRWLQWVCGVALIVFAAFLIALDYAARHAEPMLRKRLIATLEDRFRSPVELDELHISVVKGIQVSGSGLRILSLSGDLAAPRRTTPVLSVRSFQFRTGVRQLLEPTMRLDEVRVQGLRLDVPPKSERRPLLPTKGKPGKRPKLNIIVDRIVCSDMVLTIETDQPGKQPLVFPIRDLTLHDAGRAKPMPFEAQLINPKPVGEIHSAGHIGPWNPDEPRDTPVDGNYSFTDADLSTISGINGTLASHGSYGGTLGEIDVTGTTETPDFSLDVSEHPVDLRTSFRATVDGTTGDTYLHSVHATLLHTVLDVKGKVVRADDPRTRAGSEAEAENPDLGPGHLIDLTVHSSQARVEDILQLGAKTSPPLMRGAMMLDAHLNIPPGHVTVSRKMRVDGRFTIRGATLSNEHWQDTVDRLSARAQGNAEQAKRPEAPPVVQSDVNGTFHLANAGVSIPDLHYQMAGAQVDLAGTYSLNGQTFNFAGTVRTQATASQMLTGWKSILAMPFDKLLQKNGAGVEVPVRIDGTRSDPKFGVDTHKLGDQIMSHFKKRSDKGNQDQPQGGQPEPPNQPPHAHP